jgi:hypothetical protein
MLLQSNWTRKDAPAALASHSWCLKVLMSVGTEAKALPLMGQPWVWWKLSTVAPKLRPAAWTAAFMAAK